MRILSDLSEFVVSALGEMLQMLKSEVKGLLPSSKSKDAGLLAAIDNELTGAYGDDEPLGNDKKD